MGKKGSWFSAIKRVFTSHSKEKPVNESEKKSSKEKKKGRGRLKNGPSRSFIPLFREPSSIEKILGEVDQQKLFVGDPTTTQPSRAEPSSSTRPESPKAAPPRATSPRRAAPESPKAAPPRTASLREAAPTSPSPQVAHRLNEISHRPEPTPPDRHLSATRIQAAYRGYMARRSVKALTGFMRLQGVVSGPSVWRQTANAMKKMQLLVRVQSQIQSRRIQMLETQRPPDKSEKEIETGDEEWDDSVMTVEEQEARRQRKAAAVFKRERAMAYAYSHQVWKASPRSAAQNGLSADFRRGGFPWWWNWLERQLPPDGKNPELTAAEPSPRPQPGGDNVDTPTPSRPTRTKPSGRTPPRLMKHSRGGYPLKDDDSLVSCPAFSVPNYMSPTASAKAKVRPTSSQPKEGRSPASESTVRRLSFPPTPSNMGSTPQRQKYKSPGSIGDLSMDSAVSMPPTLGRKPFNRFV